MTQARTRASPWLGALAGVASGAAGLAAGQLAAAVVDARSAPLIVVAQASVEVVPAWLKEFAISAFGTHDKAMLIGSALVVVLLLCALAGRAAQIRPAAGVCFVALLSAFALAVALTRPEASWSWVVPSLACALVGGGVLLRLGRAATLAAEPDGSRRRLLLQSGALLAVGAAIVAVGSRVLQVAAPRPALPPVPPQDLALPRIAAGLTSETAEITPLWTPTADFYRIDTALTVPNIDPERWQLRIEGMVENPFTLSYAELLALPMIERDISLCCVSNPVGGELAGGARWQGALLAPLLRRARPRADADMVLSGSDDGFTASTPLPVLLDGRSAMIAVGMNGEPLPDRHGYPARLVTPGLYGFVGATKWLTTLTVTRFDRDRAYWSQRGWSERGPVKTAARIDVPHSGQRLPAGAVTLGGIAWATHRGIRAVEASVDGGPFQPCELGDDIGVDFWRQWRLQLALEAGEHTVRARAVDGRGEEQTAAVADTVPDGATGWHTVRFRLT